MNATNRHGTAKVTLPSDLEIRVTRQFDAPAALVFKAWTTPELVRRWWGFETSVWRVCEIDLRVGGRWRFVTFERNSFEVAFNGEYREIDAPHRIVSTEVYEGYPDPNAAAVNTILFEEQDGVTTMTVTTLHSRQEHRDAHLNSGMEGGMQVSMDRMEDLVDELARAA